MREIKFRAWNGKYMVTPAYGDWVSFDGVPYTEASRRYDTPNVEIEKAKDYVLMQFTGLKDKNGKEIYEGDIVRSETYEINRAVVEWSYSNWEPFQYFMSMIDEDFEVIGNIHQNPDLLTS